MQHKQIKRIAKDGTATYEENSASLEPVVVESPQGAATKFLTDRYVSLSLHTDRPVTAEEYARLLFDGLKEGSLGQRDWFRMLSGVESEPEPGKKIALNGERFDYYRKVLDAVVQLNKSTPRHQSHGELRSIMEGALYLASVWIEGRVAALPWVRTDTDRLRLDFEYQVIGCDQQASFDYAFFLVLSKYRPEVRKCRLATCGKFFLKAKGRDKQRGYCCLEHSLERTDSLVARRNRVYASRAGLSSRDWESILQVDSAMTPKKWNDMMDARPSLTPQKWIAEQKRKQT